jgi:hypothetical protein
MAGCASSAASKKRQKQLKIKAGAKPWNVAAKAKKA